MAGTEARDWVFLVLTIDRNGHYSNKPWKNEQDAYRELSRMSRNLLSSLKRGPWGITGKKWVAVVEAHRSGWPHVNLLIHAPNLAAELRAAQEAMSSRNLWVFGELRDRVTATGWGEISSAEPVRSLDAANGYVTKLAGAADQTTGEISKLCQAPLNAPPNFRRLRSAKGFLPPKRKNPDTTGTLIRRTYSTTQAPWEAVPLRSLPDHLRAVALLACEAESERIIEESRRRMRKTRPLPDSQTVPIEGGKLLLCTATGPPVDWGPCALHQAAQ